MFLDASAIIGIIAEEDDWTSLSARLGRAEQTYVSSLCIWEASLGLSHKRRWALDEAEHIVRRFVGQIAAEIVAIDDEIGREALRASRLYGKGRHPAALNMGDCFAYAAARTHGVALLYKGNDFARTDLVG